MLKNLNNFVLEILGDCEWELVGSGIDGVYDGNFDFQGFWMQRRRAPRNVGS